MTRRKHLGQPCSQLFGCRPIRRITDAIGPLGEMGGSVLAFRALKLLKSGESGNLAGLQSLEITTAFFLPHHVFQTANRHLRCGKTLIRKAELDSMHHAADGPGSHRTMRSRGETGWVCLSVVVTTIINSYINSHMCHAIVRCVPAVEKFPK